MKQSASTMFILKMYVEQVNNMRWQLMGQIHIMPLEELTLAASHINIQMCVIPLDADKFDVTRGTYLYDWLYLNGFIHSNHLVPNRATKKVFSSSFFS